MFDFLGKRKWFFLFSSLIIIPGIILMFVFGLRLGIDFTGGTRLEVKLPNAQLTTATVENVVREHGFQSVLVQLTEDNVAIIRTQAMTDPQKVEVVNALGKAFETEPQIMLFDSVGPTVGREIALRAVGAVAIAAIAIALYIIFAFRKVSNPVRYGLSAVAALIHDVLVVLSFAAITGRLFHWEVDALFVTAALTVVGFSVHDTIVNFDRIRENLLYDRRSDFEVIANRSVLQSLTRSINTQLTAVLALLAVVLFGGDTLRTFTMTMMVGLLSGTYSSICIAVPLLVVWEKNEWGSIFGKRK
jgi:preprotein translocase subunit SecF